MFFFLRFTLYSLFLVSAPTYGANSLERTLKYEVRLALLNAGDLTFKLSFSSLVYDFFGMFKTSGIIDRYYSWEGEFAGVGMYTDDWPSTINYYSRSRSKDHELKIVLLSPKGVRLLESGGNEFKNLARPAGDDLVSALFFSPDCYRGKYLNDGEDTFEIQLLKRLDLNVKSLKTSPAVNCHYKVKDYKGRTRRLNVELDKTSHGVFASKIRVKLALLPDIVFKLKEIG